MICGSTTLSPSFPPFLMSIHSIFRILLDACVGELWEKLIHNRPQILFHSSFSWGQSSVCRNYYQISSRNRHRIRHALERYTNRPATVLPFDQSFFLIDTHAGLEFLLLVCEPSSCTTKTTSKMIEKDKIIKGKDIRIHLLVTPLFLVYR